LICCLTASLSEIFFNVAVFHLSNIFPFQTECFVFVQDKNDFVKKVRKQASSRMKHVIQSYDLGAANAAFRKLHGVCGLLTSPPGVLLCGVLPNSDNCTLGKKGTKEP